jgi:Ran GTPase-activating protein (RanGAP) involved in mRNA processing and transport
VGIAKALRTNSTLHTLLLEYNYDFGDDNHKIGNIGAVALAKALESNTTIQRLGLDRNNIGDEGARALAEALKNSSALQMLWKSVSNLNSPKRTSMGVHMDNVIADPRFLADAWKQAKTFSSLRLGLRGNKIGNDGATALAEALKGDSRLQRLDLSDNNISKSLKCRIRREISAENCKEASPTWG